MNSCRTVHELLEQARDERLPALVQSALDSHLGSCPDCARLAVLEAELNEGLAALRADADELELPADFRRQVKERILASDRGKLPRRTHWAGGFTAGLAAAACLVLAVVAVFALRGGVSPQSPIVVQATGPAAALPGDVASSFGEPGLLHSKTAPLLYATPEVEVIFDGSQHDRFGSQGMQPASATATDEEPEPGSGRREYHF
jgi:anti-sigma factor RsiW